MSRLMLRRCVERLLQGRPQKCRPALSAVARCPSHRNASACFSEYFNHRPGFRLAGTKTVISPRAYPPPSRRQVGPFHLLAASGGVLAFVLIFLELAPSRHDEVFEVPSFGHGAPDGGKEMPSYRLSEIKQHGSDSERPWVTYKGKVYDIGDWIPAHPGGDVILRAAGGSIEPYWDIFSIHKTQHVCDILEQYLIGRVHPCDTKNTDDQIEDPFVSDPTRDERLRFLTRKPCNAETPREELVDSFLTPNKFFYVRNHMWVPQVDNADGYEITIELQDGAIKTYTIEDLRTRFRQHTVTAVLQCAGNRRKDMTDRARKTNGLQWTVGAISCARWEGVRLRDVLADAGLPQKPDGEAQHVQFSGLEAYGASIPISSALDPRGDVLLALRMNDEPLPRDHGFPVRVIVPGHVAARSVKWLRKIIVSDEESDTPWQRRDYKCFGPNEMTQDWDKYEPIQNMPVTSAITSARTRPQSPLTQVPSSSADRTGLSGIATEHGPVIELEGYAYSGGGHRIQRVDVSLDGGMTWDQASLAQADTKLEKGSQSWCWKRWRYEGRLPNNNTRGAGRGVNRERKTTLVVKATDDAYNTQPETQSSIYNLRGNLATAWHRVDYTWNEPEEI